MTESVFLKALETESAKKLTENGAAAMKTAGAGTLLDLFAVCGAMRMRKQDVMAKYAAALNEDRLLAAKLAFYTRDIRGGLGERETARVMFATLAVFCPEIMRKNLALVPEYGRWDDLFVLMKVPALKADVIALLGKQLEEDLQSAAAGRPVSLLAKWMPSVNTSSYESRKLARKLAAGFGMSERDYRRMLSGLRAYLNVTEVRLSEREYSEIRYPTVPSGAMLKYRNAFARHDSDRFAAYLQDVESGKAAIHAGTLFPYDVAGNYIRQVFSWNKPEVINVDLTAEALWKSLPDYVSGDGNVLVMADLSGSMMGRPIEVSVSLAVYFAQHARGSFANTFMTFSAEPDLVRLSGKTLLENILAVSRCSWGYNTDLEKAFELVLKTAVMHQIPAEEMPKSIIVISDNEIDRFKNTAAWRFADEMKARFAAAGYAMPNLVLWNVAARNDTFHASGFCENVQMCSGASASVFASLLEGMYLTPYEYMLKVLNNSRYDAVTI